MKDIQRKNKKKNKSEQQDMKQKLWYLNNRIDTQYGKFVGNNRSQCKAGKQFLANQ